MDRKSLETWGTDFVNTHEGNYISKAKAFTPNLVGLKIYEPPIFAYASSEDIEFSSLLEPEVKLPDFFMPKEWLTNAKTVVSFFLPFTREVKESNAKTLKVPSDEWLHARIEGQAFLVELCLYLAQSLAQEGYKSVVPAADKRFFATSKAADEAKGIKGQYASNWSERHVAYICGLGTFGLSKGIITEKGTGGRLGSLITELLIPSTGRRYSGLYDNCTNCGKCIANCPVNAISFENGKDHNPCKLLLDETRKANPPYYGCGKCQVGVPCESSNPKRTKDEL